MHILFETILFDRNVRQPYVTSSTEYDPYMVDSFLQCAIMVRRFKYALIKGYDRVHGCCFFWEICVSFNSVENVNKALTESLDAARDYFMTS